MLRASAELARIRQGLQSWNGPAGCFGRVLNARLWHDHGKTTEARDLLLAPIDDWFTESFDTPDPKVAKTLLDELS